MWVVSIGNVASWEVVGVGSCSHLTWGIYERIVVKGKSKKLALIAVANKLLKQAFAIAKSGRPYDENFVSRLA